MFFCEELYQSLMFNSTLCDSLPVHVALLNYILFFIFSATPSFFVLIEEYTPPTSGKSHTIVCSHNSSDRTFQYTPSYTWRHNGVVIDTTLQELYFPMLDLNDAGNYTCKVQASSIQLGIVITNMSNAHQIILQCK